MLIIPGILASQRIAGDYESIATVTVGSGGSSTIDFTSISSTYKHLQIRYIARTTGTGNYRQGISMRANSDTGSNYSFHRLWGNGSTVSAAGLTSQTSMLQVGFATDGSGLASSFGTGVIDILNYTNTNKYTTVRSLTGFDNNTTGGTGEQGGALMLSNAWLNTAAITSLSLFPDSATNFAQYSHFALYGVKG